MPNSLYKLGTVSVTNGSTTVTGAGTSWLPTDIRPGDMFKIAGGAVYFVEERVGSTELKLDQPYAGTTGAGLSYTILRMSGDWGSSRLLAAQVAEYIRTLKTGELFEWVIALSHEDGQLSEQVGVVQLRVPKDIEVTELNLFLNQASDSGNVVLDIMINGTSVLSTKLTCNQGHVDSSDVGTTPYVLVNPLWLKGDILRVDFLTAGNNAEGAKLTISGQRSI